MDTIFENLFRFLFFWIDSIVYGLITAFYSVFTLITDINIFSVGTLQAFSSRIYALIGIFMLFKFSVSLIQYAVNPDDFLDKSKGGKKLVINTMVMFVLIAIVPIIFSWALELQQYVLKENTIGNLILGINKTSSDKQSSVGKNISYSIFEAFFMPDEIVGCANRYDVSDPSNPTISSDCIAGISAAAKDGDIIGQNYKDAFEKSEVEYLLRWDMVFAEKTSGGHVFKYTPIVSTAVGAFAAWIILMFCFDIAVRSVKLGFLQLIAPVPIVSYLDPKGGKDGMFKKWVQNCIKTYADLFIRLIAIFFAVFVIAEIANNPYMTSFTNPGEPIPWNITSAFAKVFIIIGTLLFAKELPKMLEDLFGFKLSGGGFSLNPVKKLSGIPLAGGALAAGAVGAGSLAVGGLAAGKSGIGNQLRNTKMGQSKFGQQMLGDKVDVGENFKQRMRATGAEMSGRVKGSGVMGSDKYSGDTIGKILSKDDTTSREAARANLDADKMQKVGADLYRTQQQIKASGRDSSEIFQNSDYRESYKAVGEAKKAMYGYKNTAQMVSSKYSAAMQKYSNMSEEDKSAHMEAHGGVDFMDSYTKELEKANELEGKFASRYEVAKKKHDNVKKQHSHDAHIEEAIDYYDKITTDSDKQKSYDGSSYSTAQNNGSSSNSGTNSNNPPRQ